MQNAINPLMSIAEDRAALIERSHEAARQLELDSESTVEIEAILTRARRLHRKEA